MNVIISEIFVKGKKEVIRENKWFVAKYLLDIPQKYFNQKESNY